MTIDHSRLRQDFPYLSERCYLNTAAAGLSWAGQESAAAAFYRDAKARGINGRPNWLDKHRSVVPKVRALLRGFDGEIEFFSNTTEILNLVAHSLDWRHGDEIVVAADEFPSVASAFEFAASRGAQLRMVPINDERTRTSALCEAMTDRTRVVAVSHVHWATGTVVDLSMLGEACRRRDALLIVDGIQAMGATALDLRFVDVYCGSVFKWLLSGFGLSIAGIGPRARARLRPAYRGYANPSPDDGLRYAHMNYPAIYVLDATLDHLATYRWAAVFEAVRTSAQRLAKGVSELGYQVQAPEEARAGIISFATSDADRHRDVLANHGVDVEARFGMLRCSPHFYNTFDDIDRLLDELRRF